MILKNLKNIYSHKLIIAIPAYLLSGSTTLVLIFVDGIFAGNFIGKEAIVGISLASPLMFICGAIVAIVARGTSISLSKTIGTNSEQEQWEICKTGAILTFALMVLFVFVQPISLYFITLGLPHDSQSVIACRDYVTGVFTANIAGVISTVGLYVLISYGKSKLILAMTITEVVANIVFEFIFVCIFNLGVFGSGLGTSVANVVRMTFTIIVLHRELDFFKIITKRLKLKFLIIIKNGFPQFILKILPSISLVLINYLVMFTLGEDGILAKSLGGYAIQIALIVSSSVNSSLEPLLGLSKGTNDIVGERRLVRNALAVAFLLSLVVTVLLFAFPQILFFIFGVADANDFVIYLFRTLEITCITNSISSILFTYMVYSEKRLFASVLSCIENIILVPAVMLIFSNIFPNGLFFSYFICELITIFCYLFMYWKICVKFKDGRILYSYFDDSSNKISLASNLNKLEDILKGLSFNSKFVLKSRLLAEEILFFNRFLDHKDPAYMRFGFVVFEDEILFYSIDNGAKWEDSINHNNPNKYVTDNYLIAKHFTDKLNYKYVLDLNYFSYMLKYSQNDKL